jgi:(S)-2-hydroxyglutarate dehydrogenase
MNFDVIIIGGGIVGLATALKSKELNPKLKVCILEKEPAVAFHQTGNNSGVIHSGIYYRPGSLKSQNCLKGYNYLLQFCEKYNINYELTGKIIVATSSKEIPGLDELYSRGLANGLTKIKKLTPDEISEFEPHVYGIAGIHVPYTGITDFKKVSEKIAEVFLEKYSGEIYFSHKAEELSVKSNSVEVIASGEVFNTKLVVNTGGLYSDRIANMSGQRTDIKIIPFRGEYYKLRPESEYLVNSLIYPVPDSNFPFLGVHFTRRINGSVEAGPNAVFAFKREGYRKTDFSVRDLADSLSWPGFQKVMFKYLSIGLGEYYRSFNKIAFTKALQRLIPELKTNDLIPGGAGIRAQACDRNGKLIDDFYFNESSHVINVLNAPSPAATASFAIGEQIAGKIISRFL